MSAASSPAAGSEELRKRIDQIVMATINHGHQVITEQHSKEKSYVYVAGVGDKLVLTRLEAIDAFVHLITAQNNATYEAVMGAITRLENEHWGGRTTAATAELRQSIAKIFGKEIS